MQSKLIFNCFKLCLLIVICTAAPLSDLEDSDSDTSSNSDTANHGKIVKLQGDENAKNGDAGDDVLSDDAGANEGPINAEEKEDAPIAGEVQSGENGVDAVQDNDDPVNADEHDAPATDEPKDTEIQDNEVQDNEVQDDNPKATQHVDDDEEDAHVTDEPIYGENKDNAEVHDDSSDATEDPIHADEKNDPATVEPIDEGKKDKDVHDNASDANDIQDDRNRNFGIREDNTLGFKLSQDEMTKFKIWPEAKIPYYIDELSYDKVLRDKIRQYLDEARSLTGLQFEELTEPPEVDADRWVFFVNRRGQLDCKDYNTNSFTNSGVQKVIIGYNCLQHGGPMAAIVLALVGVPPQHNAPDRDKYINVVTDHILPEKRGLFKRLKDGDWLFHDMPYDVDSVSHYPTYKYTADGSQTIQLLLKPGGLKQRRQRSRKATGTGPSDYFPQWRQAMGATEDITLDIEKRTYSRTDLVKILYLYSNIMQNQPQGIKPEDCKALYRAGPNYRNMKLTERKKKPGRPKPAKYLAAVKNDNNPDKLLSSPVDIKGEVLSDLDDE